MNTPLDKYASAAADWRGEIQKNNRKTFIVIAIFFLIYLGIGVLVDLYIYSGPYPNTPLPDLFYSLLTLQLIPFATLIMFAVAFISIFVTLSFHNQLMFLGTEYSEINPETATDVSEKQLYNVIEELKIAAGLSYMPKVYIIDADYMNAFASGFSEQSAMVAITRGLMQKLTRSELQAVMAHEISHIRHLDIRLTLMASVLANLMVMVLDMFFYNILFSRRRDSNEKSNGLAMIIVLLRYILPLINILLLLYLSRTREYLADAGCVELLRDNEPLATALLKISSDHEQNQDAYSQAYSATPHENVRHEAYIFDPSQAGIKDSMTALTNAFSTHPSLKDRLAALGYKQQS